MITILTTIGWNLKAFNLHFLLVPDVEHCGKYFLAIYISSFENCPSVSLYHLFLIEKLVYLILFNSFFISSVIYFSSKSVLFKLNNVCILCDFLLLISNFISVLSQNVSWIISVFLNLLIYFMAQYSGCFR